MVIEISTMFLCYRPSKTPDLVSLQSSSREASSHPVAGSCWPIFNESHWKCIKYWRRADAARCTIEHERRELKKIVSVHRYTRWSHLTRLVSPKCSKLLSEFICFSRIPIEILEEFPEIEKHRQWCTRERPLGKTPEGSTGAIFRLERPLRPLLTRLMGLSKGHHWRLY